MNFTHSTGYFPIAVSAAKTNPFAPDLRIIYVFASALVGGFDV